MSCLDRRIVSFLFISFCSLSAFSQQYASSSLLVTKQIVTYDNINKYEFLHDPEIYNDCWDTLPQPQFWRQVIVLTQDSSIVNEAGSRKVFCKIATRDWQLKTEAQKAVFKDSLKRVYNLAPESSIYITAGKREFYGSFKKVVPSIGRAINVFTREGTDPWFAQAILLIESPGKMQKSSVGAFGPFQLMRSIAIKYGLKVNRYVDEREDFDKSAMAAARLIGRVCVPEIKRMLDTRCISYKETDVWFKLMVLHSYHAGSGNVSAVLKKINPTEGGMSLITEMWRTEAGGFKNASQNYSQIAIASLLRFDDIVYKEKDTVYLVEGDKLFQRYKLINNISRDSLCFLSTCMKGYEFDLLDGTVPVQYFISKIKLVEKEIVTVCTKDGCKPEVIDNTLNQYRLSEAQLSQIGQKLVKLRRVDEAIEIFKLNVLNNPKSVEAHSNLADAYKLSGNKELAMLYSKKAAGLNL